MRGFDIVWAGGEDHFKLDINHLKALQDSTNCGPAWSLKRLDTKQYHVQDIVDTIRLALECGGTPKEEARKKVKIHVEERPLSESVLLARTILTLALHGEEGDDEASGEANGVADE